MLSPALPPTTKPDALVVCFVLISRINHHPPPSPPISVLPSVDLSNNRLERRSAVAGLRALPRLAKLLLRGNPVATLGNGEVAPDGDRPWTDVFFPGVEVLSATGE